MILLMMFKLTTVYRLIILSSDYLEAVVLYTNNIIIMHFIDNYTNTVIVN